MHGTRRSRGDGDGHRQNHQPNDDDPLGTLERNETPASQTCLTDWSNLVRDLHTNADSAVDVLSDL